MAFSKAHHFNQADHYFSLVCHALSHPARIEIIRKLQDKGKLPVSELRKGIPLGKSAFSQHLKILREMHILACESVYPTVWYWINPEVPETQRALVDLIGRATDYFPEIDMNEFESVRRRRGVLVPD